MNKKVSISRLLCIVFIAMTVTFCLTMLLSQRIFENKVENVSAKEIMYEKLSEIDRTVRQNYYSTIDESMLDEGIADGFLTGLGNDDCKYYNADEMAIYNEILQGKLLGIGLDIVKSRENNGYMLVYNIDADSPADVQGIAVGDLISAIDGVSTINMSVEIANEMLQGKAGDSVEVTYIDDDDKENTATLVHKTYDAMSVEYEKIDDIGYVYISTFSQRTDKELSSAIASMPGIKALIIDIRDNNSKNYDGAAESADVLLPEGTTMYATYNDGEKKVLYTSDKDCVEVPIIIIADENTGYAAEMFAAMVRDCAVRSRIVGMRTMGKGTYQKMYTMNDGTGIEIAVAALTPVTSNIYNGTGLKPDYEKAFDTAIRPTFHVATSYSDDAQIQRAIEVANNISK